MNPLPVPPEILEAIAQSEAARINMDIEQERSLLAEAATAYFPDYVPSTMAYAGPVVVVVWPAGPEAVASFYCYQGRWQLAGQAAY